MLFFLFFSLKKSRKHLAAKIWWKSFPGQRMEKPFTIVPVIGRSLLLFVCFRMCWCVFHVDCERDIVIFPQIR